MKKIIITTVFLFAVFSSVLAVLPWSQRMANSVMLSKPTKYSTYWDYVSGTVLSGFQGLYKATGNASYLSYIEATTKASMGGFYTSTKTLDNIKEGTAVLFMYENTSSPTDKAAYQTKAASIRTLLNQTSAGISRTSEGGLWHKDPGYAWQMWGDGLYMAQPFYAQYSVLFNASASEDFDDIANQFITFESHARDAATGLLYHGWSEQPLDAASTAWADPTTGLSDNFWGRAMGWYIMGLVDALDYFPKSHDKYQELIPILERLAPALIAVQDPVSGCWYDIVNLPDSCSSTRCNYLESSASCMISYSLLKAIRLGYISNSYLPAAKKSYEGILSTFVTTSGNYVTISNNCQVSGLGGNNNRNGSFEYYMSEPVVNSDVEGKPIGPFILASLEYEALVTSTVAEPDTAVFKVITLPKKRLQVNFALQQGQKLTINIMDTNGKVLRTLMLQKNQGGSFKEEFDLSDLRTGIYMVQCISEEGLWSKKVSLN